MILSLRKVLLWRILVSDENCSRRTRSRSSVDDAVIHLGILLLRRNMRRGGSLERFWKGSTMGCETNSVMSKRENISYMNCSVAFPTQVSFIGSAIPTGSLYSADITSASGSSRYRHRRRLHIAAHHDRLLLLLRRRHLNKIARHKRTVSRNLCVCFCFCFCYADSTTHDPAHNFFRIQQHN